MFWSFKEVSQPSFLSAGTTQTQGCDMDLINFKREPKAGKKVEPGVRRDEFNIFTLDFHSLYICDHLCIGCVLILYAYITYWLIFVFLNM